MAEPFHAAKVLAFLFENPGYSIGSLLLAGLSFFGGRWLKERDEVFKSSLAATATLWTALLEVEHQAQTCIGEEEGPHLTWTQLAPAQRSVEDARRALKAASGHTTLAGEKAASEWIAWWEGLLRHVLESYSHNYESQYGAPERFLDTFLASLSARIRARLAPQWSERVRNRRTPSASRTS